MCALSQRSMRSVQPFPAYFQEALATAADAYTKENPRGCINLSIAENGLSRSMVADAIAKVPPVPSDHLVYTTAAGDPECLSAVARFLSRYITKTEIRPEQLVFTCGASAAIDLLTFALCDPSDAVLVMSPGYRGLQNDVSTRCGARILTADLSPKNSYSVDVPCLEAAWQKHKGEASGIRFCIICSPGNPVGDVLDVDTIRAIVAWARAKRIHVLFDELYALSVHGDATFVSVAEALDGLLGDDVHIVWSFSKDFCVSGLRFGAFVSQSHKLLSSMVPASFFSDVSRHGQWIAQHVLADETWLDTYIEENKRRLRACYEQIAKLLDEAQVPYIPAQAGFFVWIDLSKYMESPPSANSEMKLWRKMLQAGVLLSPGSELYFETFGWFRLCFAAAEDPETMVVAWERVRTALEC